MREVELSSSFEGVDLLVRKDVVDKGLRFHWSERIELVETGEIPVNVDDWLFARRDVESVPLLLDDDIQQFFNMSYFCMVPPNPPESSGGLSRHRKEFWCGGTNPH